MPPVATTGTFSSVSAPAPTAPIVSTPVAVTTSAMVATPATVPITSPPVTTVASLPPTTLPVAAATRASVATAVATAVATPLRIQSASPVQKPVPLQTVQKPTSPMTPRVATGNVIRIRSPLVTSTAAVATATTVAIVTTEQQQTTVTVSTITTTTATTVAGQTPAAMSGIAALAAAAAATPKITMNNVSIVPQTAVAAATATNTIRMKNVQPGQQIRFAAPGATVLRTASPQQSKQIILQKPGQNIPGQPQIVHLLKTGQGMVATVPKVSLIPGKSVQATGAKPLNQGPTILRLVNPNTVTGSKILTTMKTSNIVAMSKGQNITGKQTNDYQADRKQWIGRKNQPIYRCHHRL